MTCKNTIFQLYVMQIFHKNRFYLYTFIIISLMIVIFADSHKSLE